MPFWKWKYLSDEQIKGFDSYKVRIFRVFFISHVKNFILLVFIHRQQSVSRLRFSSILESGRQGKIFRNFCFAKHNSQILFF